MFKAFRQVLRNRPNYARGCNRLRIVPPNISLNPDASPAALARRPLGAD
jgi:hypothetical protein